MAAQYVIRLVPTPGRQALGTAPNQAQQFLVTATGVSVASLKVEIEKVSQIPSREQELIFNGQPLSDAASLSTIPVLSTIILFKRPQAAPAEPAPAAPATVSSFAAGGEPQRALEASQEDEACAICLEPYAPTYPPVTLICRHAFHEQCIVEWARQSAFCPLCRQRMQLLPSLSAMLMSSGSSTAPPSATQSAPSCAAHSAGTPMQAQQTVGFGVPAGQAAYGAYPGQAYGASGQPGPYGAHTQQGGQYDANGALVAVAGAATLAAMLRNTAAVAAPPTTAAVQAMLNATRHTLRNSPDFNTMAAMVREFQRSDTARGIGMGVQLAASAALGAALGVGKIAADALIANSSMAARTAAGMGYQPVSGPIPSGLSSVMSNPTTSRGLAAGLGAVAALAGAASTAAAVLTQPHPGAHRGAATAPNGLTAAAEAAIAEQRAGTGGAAGGQLQMPQTTPYGGSWAPQQQQQQQQQVPPPQMHMGMGGGAALQGGNPFQGAGMGVASAPAPSGKQQPQPFMPPMPTQQGGGGPASYPAPALAPAPARAPQPASTVRCPNCSCLMQPPAGARVFQCPCGTRLHR